MSQLIRLNSLFIVLTAVSFLAPSPALSQVDTFQFVTEEQQQRYRQLSDELRCPICQNTNLSCSTGVVAEDLRR